VSLNDNKVSNADEEEERNDKERDHLGEKGI
jgi:hypothetical protein